MVDKPTVPKEKNEAQVSVMAPLARVDAASLLKMPDVAVTPAKRHADKVVDAIQSNPKFMAKIRSQARQNPFAATVWAAVKYSEMVVGTSELLAFSNKVGDSLSNQGLGSAITSKSAAKEKFGDVFDAVAPDLMRIAASAATKVARITKTAATPLSLAQSKADASTPEGAAQGYYAALAQVSSIIGLSVAQPGIAALREVNRIMKDDAKGVESDFNIEGVLGSVSGVSTNLEAFKKARAELERFSKALEGFGQQGRDAKEWIEDFTDRVVKRIAMPKLLKSGAISKEDEYDTAAAMVKTLTKYAESNASQLLDQIETLFAVGAAMVEGDPTGLMNISMDPKKAKSLEPLLRSTGMGAGKKSDGIGYG